MSCAFTIFMLVKHIYKFFVYAAFPKKLLKAYRHFMLIRAQHLIAMFAMWCTQTYAHSHTFIYAIHPHLRHSISINYFYNDCNHLRIFSEYIYHCNNNNTRASVMQIFIMNVFIACCTCTYVQLKWECFLYSNRDLVKNDKINFRRYNLFQKSVYYSLIFQMYSKLIKIII